MYSVCYFDGARACRGNGGLRSTHALRQIRIAEQATVTRGPVQLLQPGGAGVLICGDLPAVGGFYEVDSVCIYHDRTKVMMLLDRKCKASQACHQSKAL